MKWKLLYTGLCRGHLGLQSKLLVSPLIMENQMEKNMDTEMEASIHRVMQGILGVTV